MKAYNVFTYIQLNRGYKKATLAEAYSISAFPKKHINLLLKFKITKVWMWSVTVWKMV